MSEYNTKNYTEQGGEKTVIGGTLEFKEGAQVVNLPAGVVNLPVAASDTLGGVKVGSRLSIDENGVLSADNQMTAATAQTLGGIKVGNNLSIDENGVLSAQAATPAAATLSTAGVVKQAAHVNKGSMDLVGVETFLENVVAALIAAGIMAEE